MIISNNRLADVFKSYSFGYGHAALRYTLPSGKQILINICNPATGNPLVNFLDPTDYFFSTSDDTYEKSEQYGIYGRSYVTIRIERVDPIKIVQMHDYFLALADRADKHQGTFSCVCV